MTPEGKVKKMINNFLDSIPSLYYERPVPTGFGKSGLDYTLCLWGHFVVIEAKAPGEWLTPRQRERVLQVLSAGGSAFAISNVEGLEAFKNWVERCRKDFASTADS